MQVSRVFFCYLLATPGSFKSEISNLKFQIPNARCPFQSPPFVTACLARYDNPMHVVIFEGVHWRSFMPFALSRPVFMLPCGAGTLLDKQLRATNPTRLTLWVRPGLEDYCRRLIVPKMPCPTEVNAPLDDEPALLLSGRTLHLSGFEYED